MSEGLSDQSASDRRAADRASITLRVDYKRLNTFFADYTKNISKGGTFIRTTKPLDVGTEFVFVLSFPSAEGQLKLRGEVMWVVPEEAAKEEHPPGMGIRFLFEDDAARTKVHDFVKRLMTDALGPHIASRLIAEAATPKPSGTEDPPPTRRPE
ncbi:MAG: TIGR02266 family protein [Myxococcales bacterium]|nr:TIGR02266 family protein [Myxococcales bacterium]